MVPLSGLLSGLGLSSEQESLREVASLFAKDKIRPVAAGLDERAEFPRAIIQEGHGLGLINLTIPAEYGGSGLGIFDACLVIEEIPRPLPPYSAITRHASKIPRPLPQYLRCVSCD